MKLNLITFIWAAHCQWEGHLAHRHSRSLDTSWELSLDTNSRCRANESFVWCLPADYNQEKHPFTCQ